MIHKKQEVIMKSLESRIANAQQLWQEGFEAEASGNLKQAYQRFTAAHNLIMDCAHFHQYAHEQLRRVNREIGNYGELTTDYILHMLAPLGFFKLVSFVLNRQSFFSELCKRRT
jgi:hypothetical protein